MVTKHGLCSGQNKEVFRGEGLARVPVVGGKSLHLAAHGLPLQLPEGLAGVIFLNDSVGRVYDVWRYHCDALQVRIVVSGLWNVRKQLHLARLDQLVQEKEGFVDTAADCDAAVVSQKQHFARGSEICNELRTHVCLFCHRMHKVVVANLQNAATKHGTIVSKMPGEG